MDSNLSLCRSLVWQRSEPVLHTIDRLHIRPLLTLTLVGLLLVGCAPVPDRSPTTGYREYRYLVPASVREADREECAVHAESEADVAASTLSYKTEETIGTLFGPVGAIATIFTASARTRNAREKAYEQTMKVCLKEKGYVLPEESNR